MVSFFKSKKQRFVAYTLFFRNLQKRSLTCILQARYLVWSTGFDIDWQDISKLSRAVASHIMPTMNYFDSYISNGTNTVVHLRMVAHNLSLYDEMGRSTFHIVKFNNICTHRLNWSVQMKRTIHKETVNNIFKSDFIK